MAKITHRSTEKVSRKSSFLCNWLLYASILLVFGGVHLTNLVPIVSTTDNVSQSQPSVVIVGAGASGLTAAKTLIRIGFKVTILEASGVFGGRVRKTDTFADFPIDLGASFVYQVERLKFIKGSNVDIPETKGLHDRAGDGEYLWADQNTWYDFFANHIVDSSVSDSIVYNCKVYGVEYHDKSVQASCLGGENQDQRLTFSADYAIVTAPLSILQDGDIAFDPPLPELLVDEHPGYMWSGIKVLLEFSEKFYNTYFEIEEPEDGECEFWDYSAVHPSSQQNIVAGYFIGSSGLKYVNKNDADIVEDVLKKLDDWFDSDEATKYYKKHMVINWSKEPHIRGSYSSADALNGAQNVQDRLFLAGEAFAYPKGHHGWVDGAALSGKHAALQIANMVLGNISTNPMSVLYSTEYSFLQL